MDDHEANLDHIIAPFFDAKILNQLRNYVLVNSAPYEYIPGLLTEAEIDLRPYMKVWQAMRAFLFSQVPTPKESKENFEDFRKLYLALQDKVDDFETQIRDTVFGATCRLYIWAKDAPQIWTSDRHEYGLLYQAFGDVGVYYILHMGRKTIAFINDADVMDQAIEELRRVQVPIYTELPWPLMTREDRRNRLLGKSNNDKTNT